MKKKFGEAFWLAGAVLAITAWFPEDGEYTPLHQRVIACAIGIAIAALGQWMQYRATRPKEKNNRNAT